MRNIISLFLALTIFIAACDKIEGPYLKNEDVSHTLVCDTPQFEPLPSGIYKKILFEEFTGHMCVNCPAGHETAARLVDAYGDSIIIVSIHAGPFAVPSQPEYPNDYRTEVGTALNDAFDVDAYPAGTINRIKELNAYTADRSRWMMMAKKFDKTDVQVAIQMIVNYDAEANGACVHVKTTFLSAVERKLNLSIFLVESGIISPQSNANPAYGDYPVIMEYEHNNMLRGALNSAWGEQIANNDAQANQEVYKQYGYSFEGKSFKPQNCSFVAIVYDSDTYEVLQAEEVKIAN
ncbi:MAG: Omp28 family outer membrane lipoprotein [Bacteroidales bacterium]|jgi:hypothetical protein|nr:Omp28 family outer membrane lipoprotein [Bacteroidales bacterium]